MCRINGILHHRIDVDLLRKMRDSLSHGGPDDAGEYVNQNIGLGHRRLSIIDLSVAGHQPMRFKELVIVFNGEIYNYKEVSEELVGKGYVFTSNSDTEVILKAFDCWSYDAVHKFRGMFSFAIWNEVTKKLLLCRDRLGVKPLYWYLKDDLFMFASELKSFCEHPLFDKSINQDAVSLFLQTGYIRSPYCIYKYAHKLEQGGYLEIDTSLNLKTWKYWDIREKYKQSSIKTDSEDNLIEQCEALLSESFKLRMVADVPVGMFLSGGIDSSLVTALLQKQSSIPLNTFTIGFEDKRFNEGSYAKSIAKHLGTNHTELYCNEKHFEEIIGLLPHFYDEPFGDCSAIPTYLVSKLARQSVTVSLSADGGDEIFAGYNRYLFAEELYSFFMKIPAPLRSLMSKTVGEISSSTIEKIVRLLPLPEHYKKNIDARLPKLVETLKSQTLIDFLYSSTLFISKNDLKKVHNYDSKALVFNKDLELTKDLKYSGFCVADVESYLEGDILTKVDRATMQVALEGREPFLDHKIVEFALSLPDNLKIRNGETKWILRQILYKYVPKELIDRPKMGFGIPLDKWLSSTLRPELTAILLDAEFLKCFNLNSDNLAVLINTYLKGKSHSPYFIWYVYCLHQWYLKWK